MPDRKPWKRADMHEFSAFPDAHKDKSELHRQRRLAATAMAVKYAATEAERKESEQKKRDMQRRRAERLKSDWILRNEAAGEIPGNVKQKFKLSDPPKKLTAAEKRAMRRRRNKKKKKREDKAEAK